MEVQDTINVFTVGRVHPTFADSLMHVICKRLERCFRLIWFFFGITSKKRLRNHAKFEHKMAYQYVPN